MKFLTSLRGERLLADLKSIQDPDSPAFRRVVQKLVGMGGPAIPMIIEALPGADRRETLAYVEVLGALADSRNLSTLLAKSEELLRQNRNHVLAVAHALETYKTLSGNDVQAVIEGRSGDVLDGSVYHSNRLGPLCVSRLHRSTDDITRPAAAFRASA